MVRKPNPAAVQALVGFASDGSPLRDLFSALTQGTPDTMADTLASGIAQGLNARVVGRQLRQQFGVPAARALLIARTETHRAYNEATMQTYRANDDILGGWIWASACDRRSCGACFAMHGSRHKMNETLDGHPGCRCKAVPIVKGFEPPKIVPGAERFAALPEDVQRRVLGPGRWQAWNDGKVTLTATGERSIVARRTSKQWGTMRTVRSLRAIRRG
jgi:SPP1 gp7 family putative phage head morphogenesis protein